MFELEILISSTIAEVEPGLISRLGTMLLCFCQ